MEAPRCGGCGSFMEVLDDRGNMVTYECCGRTVPEPKDEYHDLRYEQNVF